MCCIFHFKVFSSFIRLTVHTSGQQWPTGFGGSHICWVVHCIGSCILQWVRNEIQSTLSWATTLGARKVRKDVTLSANKNYVVWFYSHVSFWEKYKRMYLSMCLLFNHSNNCCSPQDLIERLRARTSPRFFGQVQSAQK